MVTTMADPILSVLLIKKFYCPYLKMWKLQLTEDKCFARKHLVSILEGKKWQS